MDLKLDSNNSCHSEEESDDSISPWPTMAVDGTAENPEKEHLDRYHKTAVERGFYWYMPKNSDEMNRLYNFFGGAQCQSVKEINDTWKSILRNINEEIIARCLDRDLYFIDKYLGYLDEFISLSASYPDSKFTEFLYDNSNSPGSCQYNSNSLEHCLWSSAVDVMSYVNSNSEENNKYTIESTHILYVVDRISKAISKTGKGKLNFFDLFCELHINTDYKQTPVFRSLLNEFGRVVFGSEIKIDLH